MDVRDVEQIVMLTAAVCQVFRSGCEVYKSTERTAARTDLGLGERVPATMILLASTSMTLFDPRLTKLPLQPR